MKKLWMQAKANLGKTKSASTILIVMFIIAAFLLNTGLLVVINYGNHFNELKKELSPADAYYLMPKPLYNDDVSSYIKDSKHTKNIQEEDVMLLSSKISYKGKDESFSVLFNNMDESRKASKWKFVGEHLASEEMSIYVPDIFKANSGYELNDKIKLKYTDRATEKEKSLTFTIKGYTEDIFFSSKDTGFVGFYLPEETYKKVETSLKDNIVPTKVLFTDLDDVSNVSEVESGIRDILKLNSASMMSSDESSLLVAIDIELIETARCMMASMVSAMMVVFAMIIVIVCLLVVRFRIVNSIEEDVMKIGSLKSIGYTSKQIISSILMQFLLITGIGSLLGIALSYPALPTISNVFEQQSGLKWEQGFDGKISAIAFLSLIIVVVIVALLAARNVNKLSPINALRGETSSRKYKKNHLPLEKTRGKISPLLAFKYIIQNIKQNIMIGFILIAVTFAGTFGVIMYYNTTVDTKAFAEVPGFEVCNVIATLNPNQDQTSTIDTIKNMDTVRKVQYFDEVKVKVDGKEVAAFLMDDYSKKETKLAYEGRYPKSTKEIAIAGVLAERLDKNIGDKVSLTFEEKKETFTIVGLSNGSSMGGLNSSILAKDFKEINPDFKQQALNIYLDEGSSASDFIKELKKEIDKDLLLGALNFDKEMAAGMASYQNIVAAMGLGMLIITLLVVALVLYFLISSSVIKRKRELGILKAIGFTTFQLMNQLSISFTIPIVLGSAIGTVLGAIYTNPIMSFTMKGMGIMRANFIVDIYWVIGFGIAIIVFSYLLSLLVTWKIRKISPYELVTE